MVRRKFTLDDKIKIIKELNTWFTHAQVCKKYELSSSTLSTFKRQLDIINATEPKDYKPRAKERALEEENRKLRELVVKKELPTVEDKVALAREY